MIEKCEKCKKEYDPSTEFVEDCELMESMMYFLGEDPQWCPDCIYQLKKEIGEIIFPPPFKKIKKDGDHSIRDVLIQALDQYDNDFKRKRKHDHHQFIITDNQTLPELDREHLEALLLEALFLLRDASKIVSCEDAIKVRDKVFEWLRD